MQFIKIIEKILKKKAKVKYSKFQDGDIKDTKANIKLVKKYLKFRPKTNIVNGIKILLIGFWSTVKTIDIKNNENSWPYKLWKKWS